MVALNLVKSDARGIVGLRQIVSQISCPSGDLVFIGDGPGEEALEEAALEPRLGLHDSPVLSDGYSKRRGCPHHDLLV
jgi:hypothetical protein